MNSLKSKINLRAESLKHKIDETRQKLLGKLNAIKCAIKKSVVDF